MIRIENKGKDKKNDKSFFKAMNYEIAAEHGIVNNEEMKKNEKLKGKSKNSNL